MDRDAWNALEERTLSVLCDMSPTDISKIARAFATVWHASKTLLDKVAHVSAAKTSNFSPQSLANTTWACATVGHSAPLLFDAVSKEAMPRLGTFNPQAMANTAWAHATVGHSAPLLFDAIAEEAKSSLSSFNPQVTANTAWAFATVGHSVPSLFDAVAEEAMPRLDNFNPQDTANTAWACAAVGHLAPLLFDAVAEEAKSSSRQVKETPTENAGHLVEGNAAFDSVLGQAEVRPSLCVEMCRNHTRKNSKQFSSRATLNHFSPQVIANTAWAHATIGHLAPSLFNAVSTEAMPRLDNFNPQDMSNTAWAHATVGHSAPSLFDAIAEEAMPRLDNFNPQDMSNTAWANATVGHSVPLLFDAIAEEAMPRLDNFNLQDTANTAWAHATVGHSAPSLFHAAAEAAVSKLGSFTPQGLANMVWAHAVCDQCCDISMGDSSPFAKAFSSNAAFLSAENLGQLHQVRLWCLEHGSSLHLDYNLQQRCRAAFVEKQGNPSKLQKDVVKTLLDLGLDPKEEFRTDVGYSLDAVVRYRNRDVAVEVDRPSHFLSDRSPTGSMILKHRQLARLENYRVVSVPYWEWNAVAEKDSNTKSVREWRKKYLLEILDQAIES